MPRSQTPTPDPAESILLSSRRTFVNVAERDPAAKLWLPDYGPSLAVEEVPLEDADQINTDTLRPCPPEAPIHASQPEVAKAKGEISKWVFDTYFTLVSHSIRVYNRHRKLLNEGHADRVTLGRYRRACRLALEQILRRDLPQIPGWSWNYHFPVLPIFEIELVFATGSDDPAKDELVTGVSLRAVVEVRQPTGGEIFSLEADSSESAGSNSSSSSDSSSSGSSNLP